jgi:chromosome segregation ATPase
MPDRRLAFIRELEQADEAVAALLAELDELYEACEAVRGRALELETFYARLPAERAAAARAAEEARAAAGESRAAAERAAEELRAAEASGEGERLAAARRFDVRARDTVRTIERRLREAEQEAERLEGRADAAGEEAKELARRARRLAAALAERPRLAAESGAPPEEGLAGIAEWGTRARAALLVARGQLAADRDAVVRQANELGALVLGEPLTATSAAGVVQRVERELGTGS